MTPTDFNAQNFPPGNLHSLDLVNDVFLGSVVLIDYNYVLMALHTLQGLPHSAMQRKQVKVVFSNDLTAVTADSKNGPYHSIQPRPFCYLRGDIYAGVGSSTSDEDFAIVRIEWNMRGDIADFQLIGKSAVLPHPTFQRSSLANQKIATFLQYSGYKQIGNGNLPMFSGHVAQGPVTTVGATAAFGDGTTTAANRVIANLRSRFGSSGSGFYNEDGELVGILGGDAGNARGTFFLPIDVIYASTYVCYKTESGQRLKDIYNYRKSNGEFNGEGKGNPVP